MLLSNHTLWTEHTLPPCFYSCQVETTLLRLIPSDVYDILLYEGFNDKGIFVLKKFLLISVLSLKHLHKVSFLVLVWLGVVRTWLDVISKDASRKTRWWGGKWKEEIQKRWSDWVAILLIASSTYLKNGRHSPAQKNHLAWVKMHGSLSNHEQKPETLEGSGMGQFTVRFIPDKSSFQPPGTARRFLFHQLWPLMTLLMIYFVKIDITFQ